MDTEGYIQGQRRLGGGPSGSFGRRLVDIGTGAGHRVPPAILRRRSGALGLRPSEPGWRACGRAARRCTPHAGRRPRCRR
eukprot:4420581-Alexandrium_andersonii.AAC.1